MKSVGKFAVSVAVCSLLTACGGGGSGGGVNSTPTPPPAGFTSFSNVQASSNTQVDGITREGTAAVSAGGNISPGTVSTPTEGTGTVTFGLDGSRQLKSFSVSGAQSSVSFNSSNSAFSTLTLNGQPVAASAESADGSNVALMADPFALGFNYQSFGVWGTGLVVGSTGKYGAISVGAKTSGSSVPSSGNATFRGYVGGIYTSGTPVKYSANAVFDVSFANRTVGMVTSNETFTSLGTGTSFVAGYLRITGTMSYTSGSASFSGNLSATGVTANNPFSGTGSGAFYGPSANELGGTLFLSSSAGKMVGAFGAKQ